MPHEMLNGFNAHASLVERGGKGVSTTVTARFADKWFVKGEYRDTRYGYEDVNRSQAF